MRDNMEIRGACGGGGTSGGSAIARVSAHAERSEHEKAETVGASLRDAPTSYGAQGACPLLLLIYYALAYSANTRQNRRNRIYFVV